VAGGALAALSGLAVPATAGADTPPPVTLSPPPSGGAYHSGQVIKVSVGPNKYFKPLTRVNILMCADPKGKRSTLPASVTACDGNTIQGDTVIVNKDGSFKESAYTLYRLPTPLLGEELNWKPACDRTHACVLYVGENQEDFATWPKTFSRSFLMRLPARHQRGT
jgi:hypothetical protein